MLLGTLTLCITTASFAMEQEDLKQDGWELVSNNDEWFFLNVDTPKKILTVPCGQDADSSDDYPALDGEIFNSSDKSDTETGGSGNDFGYTDDELINDEKLRDIVRKARNIEPGDFNKKFYIGLLRLAKMGGFDDELSLRTIKSIPPLHAPSLIALHKSQSSEAKKLNEPKKSPAKKKRRRKKKKKIRNSSKLLWPKMNTTMHGNPQRVLADEQKKECKAKK